MRHFESKSPGRYWWVESGHITDRDKKVWLYVYDEDPKFQRYTDKLRQFGDRYSESPAALRYGG